jgi:hypothetical protein
VINSTECITRIDKLVKGLELHHLQVIQQGKNK